MSALIVGDVHGRHTSIFRMIDQATSRGLTNVIQVGDYGSTFTRTFIRKVEEYARKAGVTLRFADGNHEDHAFLRSLPKTRDGAHLVSGHVLYQPRGSVAEIDGARVMFFGGAVSVNKTYLKSRGKLWQEQEAITDIDVAVARRSDPVDVLISHDAPSSVTLPEDLFHLEASNVIKAEAHRNRELLQEVVEAVTPKAVYHGHYHRRMNNLTTLPSGLTIPTYGLAADAQAGSYMVEQFKMTQEKSAA